MYFKAELTNVGADIKKYGWRITDVNSGRILTDTISQKNIYGTKDNMSCYYDGFLDNEKYSIEFFVETKNGKSILTNAYKFDIKYDTTFLSNDFKVKKPDRHHLMHFIMVNISGDKTWKLRNSLL